MEKYGLKEYLKYFNEGEHVKTLYVDNYCSEVKEEILEFMLKKTDKKKLLIASPGMGKSTVMMDIAQDYKMLFVAPKRGIATQMADEYFKDNGYATLLMGEDKKYITNKNMKSNLTIAVYDSVHKTRELDIDIENSFKVIDEIHQIVLAEDYRSKALSDMIDILGENTIDITATPYSLPNEGYEILRIVKRNEETKTVKFYEKHKNIPIREYVKAIVSQARKKVFIFCNNKKQGKELIEELETLNKRVLLATSNSDEISDIIKTKRFPKDVDVLISTEVLSDGVSILDKDVLDVIILKNNINPAHLIQVPKRIRRGNPTTHFVLSDSKYESEVNFNIYADSDVSIMLSKVACGNIVYKGSELIKNLGGMRTFCNYIIAKDERYEINKRLLYLDFFTRQDKLSNSCIIDMFELNGYKSEFISYKEIRKILKKLEKLNEETEENTEKHTKISYKEIDREDKVTMVVNTLLHVNLDLSNSDLVQEDYKKFTSSAINKIKKIMNTDEIQNVSKDIVEIAVELPDNFNRLADIKRAIDTQDESLPWIRLAKAVVENNGIIHTNGKTYTFIKDGKYPEKEEQERIERDLLIGYKNRISTKETFDTFMKCVYKVDSSVDKKTNTVGEALGVGYLYLQGKIIKLY